MNIELIMRRWIDILARLWLGWQERRRARHWLKVTRVGSDWVVEDATKSARSTFAAGAAENALPDEIIRAAQKSFVILELPASDIVSRAMNVPAQARDLLAGIVRNQIERLFPWRASQAAYGFNVATTADANILNVEILATSRATLDEACGQLGALGLRVDRVVADKDRGDGTVTLWSRLAEATDSNLSRTRRIVVGLMVAAVCLTLVVNVWAFMNAASADSESDEIGSRLATLQRQIKGNSSKEAIASLAPAERARALKETSPVAVVVVEALSRALPDTSYLTELNMDGSTLRIVGLAGDAPSLIAPLERSGHFRDVHFFAPTTRNADGARFVFHIEARVEPHVRIDGE
ncbi:MULTISPECIES: PilN domain-containing protein [unclassified Bradyrhizobium]|uniref:PilN domain-containing protein n=1 Tax=unclassified Bradyrhizobium TaxID=2631580 RepID=UPI001BA54B74|nr:MULTISPECIES: PilN domain-containing protein [unclassified Bradyrhizobium]MBR1201871.1 PilN domain-containing protein [Bradyrhizobium sp. AUGA SZCCT0124]MBR1311560.1 PilN domain-containing protein [Bradyrhizobium sp. AUGA SZCCT0051]MBR1338820.1 PilN domain-containing protein [Bradyrhizobium sp. AUGA SZCCT0105]MBR1353394.1 PilN domain-containing protein [Bradyrhizobium sp. AUGA SZCCT0045]